MKPYRLIFYSKKTHDKERSELRLTIDETWIEPLVPLKEVHVGERFLDPDYLMFRAIFYVNISLLRRFHPFLTILYNYSPLNKNLPSPSVNYLRIPLSYELWEGEEIIANGTPSYFVDGQTFDLFWIESLVEATISISDDVTISPIFLLSSEKIILPDLRNLLDDVRDIDSLMDALLRRFAVAIFCDGYPLFVVETNDPEIVSFLEKAPKAKSDDSQSSEE